MLTLHVHCVVGRVSQASQAPATDSTYLLFCCAPTVKGHRSCDAGVHKVDYVIDKPNTRWKMALAAAARRTNVSILYTFPFLFFLPLSR